MRVTIALGVSLLALVAATAANAAKASAPPQDEMWLQTSISGDRYEIASGKIALRKAESTATKALARRLIKDHSKSLSDAVELAHELGVGVPPAATPTQQWQINRLKNMPRGWFDAQYASLEVKDHNQDIEETGFEVREGALWEVRMEAKKDLPVLVTHLHLAKNLVAALQAAKQS
jgi:predicted outer membrane protein